MKTSSLIAIGMIAPFGCSAREACDKGLHMIVARGTDEPEGGGIMGRIADQIAGEIPDSSVTPVDYPASSDYEQSVPMGISVVTFMIKQYAHSCPDGKMALLGYSQGAQAIGDALCGRPLGPNTNATNPLNAKFQSNIVAIVYFSDPTHVPGMPWNAGTSKKQGWFHRENTSDCTPYASKMKSWCDKGDQYCDSGFMEDMAGDYLEHYRTDAVDFIVDKYKNVSGPIPASHTTIKGDKPAKVQPKRPGSDAATAWAPASTLGFVVFIVAVLALVA